MPREAGLLAAALGLAGCASVPPMSTAEVEKIVYDCSRDWADSVATGDTRRLEECLADDFLGIDPEGRMYDKPEMIRLTKTAPKYFASNKLNDVKIRVFDNAAVAQGHESWVRHDGGRGRWVWTDTYLYRNGKWQIVAAEDLKAPEPKP